MGQRAFTQKPTPGGRENKAINQRAEEKRLLSMPFPLFPRTPMPIPRLKSVPGYAKFYIACLEQPQPRDLLFANPPVYVATRGRHTALVLLSTQERTQLEQLVYSEAARRNALHRNSAEFSYRPSNSTVMRHAVWKYIQSYINIGTVPVPTPCLAYTIKNNERHGGLKRVHSVAAAVTLAEHKILVTVAIKLKIGGTELLRRALDAEFQLLLPRLHSANASRKGYYELQKVIYNLKRGAAEDKFRLDRLSRRQRAGIKRAKAAHSRAMEEFARWNIMKDAENCVLPANLLEIKIRRAGWELDRTQAQLKSCEQVKGECV